MISYYIEKMKTDQVFWLLLSKTLFPYYCQFWPNTYYKLSRYLHHSDTKRAKAPCIDELNIVDTPSQVEHRTYRNQ